MPFLLPEEVANPIEGKVATHVTSDLLENARRIVDPAERSLALRQIANGAITSNQLVLAHHTLEEAISATSQVNVPLVRDQRLIGLVTSMTALTDALLRIGRENQTMLAPDQEAEAAGLDPLPKRPESTVMIRLARLEWQRAVYLAAIIGNPTYRNEMLYRVAENEAMGSASIANDFAPVDIDSLGNRPARRSPRRSRHGSLCHRRRWVLDRPHRLRRPQRVRPRMPRRGRVSPSWPTRSSWTPGMSPTRSTG